MRTPPGFPVYTAKIPGDIATASALGPQAARREVFTALEAGVGSLKALPMSDDRAKAFIHDAFAGGILPIRLLRKVSEPYFHPQEAWPDVRPRTAWGLCSAFTWAIRGLEPARAFKATAGVGRTFGLGQRNGSRPASRPATSPEPQDRNTGELD